MFKIKSKKGTLLGLSLVIATLPFEMIFSSIAIMLYMVLLLVYSNLKDWLIDLKKNRLLLLSSAYIFLVILNLLCRPHVADGLSKLETQISLLLFPILLSISKFNLFSIKKIKDVFVISMVCFCLFSLLMLVTNYFLHFDQRNNYNFVQRYMYHFHFPYDALYINFALVLVLFGQYKSIYKKALTSLFLVVQVFFGARIGILSFLLIILIYLIANYKNIFVFKNVIYAMVMVLIFLVLVNTSSYVNDKYLDTLEKIGVFLPVKTSEIGEKYHDLSKREFLWKKSVALIQEQPIFGHGIVAAEQLLNRQYELAGRTELKNYNSHNQYLTTTLQYGIIGLLVLLLILTYCIIMGFLTRNIQFILFMTLILIAFLTESMLVRQKGVMFFAVFTSVFLLETILKRKKNIKEELI